MKKKYISVLLLILLWCSCDHYLQSKICIYNKSAKIAYHVYLGSWHNYSIMQNQKTNYEYFNIGKYTVLGYLDTTADSFSKEIEILYGSKYTVQIEKNDIKLIEDERFSF